MPPPAAAVVDEVVPAAAAGGATVVVVEGATVVVVGAAVVGAAVVRGAAVAGTAAGAGCGEDDGAGAGAGAGGCAGAGVEPCTVTVPVMYVWMLQWYLNVPAWPNVWLKVFPDARLEDEKLLSSAVTVCVAMPVFVHVTLSPTETVTLEGEKL
jgi:hypothetical protein